MANFLTVNAFLNADLCEMFYCELKKFQGFERINAL